MTSYALTLEERAASGFTHKFVLKWDDADIDVAATSAVIALLPYVAGTLFAAAAFTMPTTFTDGAATMSSLLLDVGHNGATTDDPDSLLDAYELEATGTEILGGDGNGAAFATLRTGYVALDAGNIEATLTATGANLSTLTAGEVHIFLKVVPLANL